MKAGLDGLHFHDLRGTAITRLRAAGYSVAQVCAVTGHAEKDAEAILRKYTATSEISLDILAKPERISNKSDNGTDNGLPGTEANTA
jgi:integrase